MAIKDPCDIEIECDECGECISLPTTQYIGGLPTWGISEETLVDAGWTENAEETFCPDCSKEKGDE